ncbi:MAG: alpha/beta hydrolase [Burkholderiales bacterium]|nr:alpha/beta hydrolase [Burkholderiales bacterium]
MYSTSKHFLGQGPHGFHKIFYREWGSAGNGEVLMCVHGFTRNGSDFNYLASAMSDVYRVVCPDMAGRGQSDWLPKAEYGYPLYLADAAALMARLNAKSLDWIGTSMGGFMGMMLAAQPNTPIRRLVLNDVGPVVFGSTMREIASVCGNNERFPSFDEAVAYIKSVYHMWGQLPHAQWIDVAKNSVRELGDGSYALAYDPALIAPLKDNPAAIQDVAIWPIYESIQIPMLLLHGTESTVLTAEVVEEMKRRNRHLEVVEVPGVGHAPSLMVDEHVRIIRDWLWLLK